MNADPLTMISTRSTPQSRQADPRQVPNSAGGYAFKTGREARLHRFLSLGSSGGTYYVKEQALTQDNAAVVLDWARNDATALVAEAVKISVAGRAPRNNPALFAVAAALGLGDDAGRKAAAEAVPLVARTGTHLFTLAGYCEQFRGWGPALRRAIGGWYLREPSDVAYQMLKYRQRDDWTHRDLMRLSHPGNVRPGQHGDVTPAHRTLFDWASGRDADLSELPLVAAFRTAQGATKVSEWTSLIAENPSLSWEMLPDAALAHAEVWGALIDAGMPMTALIRKLPVLTQRGLLGPMKTGYTAKVCAQVADKDRLIKARVHPVSVLLALRTYASGHAARGDGEWQPSAPVIDALDAAYYAAYGAVEPAGKRRGLFLDVSGSMGSPAGGTPITCREASAALALVTAASEPSTLIAGFTAGSRRGYGGSWGGGPAALTPLSISPRQRLDDAVRSISDLPFGGTDCSLPMTWATEQRAELDTFEIYTDNETWFGDIHPHQALERYRQKTGIDAKLSVTALTPTDFTIADPADAGTLDVSGFDSAVPSLLADFARGDI